MALHPTATQGAILSIGGAVLILLLRQGTPAGALAGAAVALVVTAGLGAAAFWPLAVFVLGAGAMTRIGRERKEAMGTAERNRGRRGVAHVAAKLGLPAVLGLAALGGVGPLRAISVGYAASLAGAFADTAATELGPLGGGSAFAIRGLGGRGVPHGSPGGISLAGLLASAAAGAALAWAALGSGLLGGVAQASIAAGAGFLASILESVIAPGALGRRLGHFGRNLFVSGSAAAIALAAWLGGVLGP